MANLVPSPRTIVGILMRGMFKLAWLGTKEIAGQVMYLTRKTLSGETTVRSRRLKITWIYVAISSLIIILITMVPGMELSAESGARGLFSLAAMVLLAANLYFAFGRRDIPKRFISATRCPSCGTLVDLNGNWKCKKCGYMWPGHIFDPCPNCRRKVDFIPCPKCGVSIDL